MMMIGVAMWCGKNRTDVVETYPPFDSYQPACILIYIQLEGREITQYKSLHIIIVHNIQILDINAEEKDISIMQV